MKQVLFSLIFCAITLQVNARITAKKHSWLFAAGTGGGNTDHSFNASGKADSTHIDDKGKFVIKGGVGVVSSNLLKSANLFRLKEYAAEPDLIYSGVLQYGVGKDVALSITGFYSKGVFNSTVNSPDDKIGIYQVIAHSVTKNHSAYELKGGAVECQVIYDRIYKTHRVVYCSASIGYVFATATQSSEKADYGANSNIPVYSYSNNRASKEITRLHLTLVGIRGGKTLCWYAELGYGFKGVLNAGVAVKL